jgi:hypothetical protein
LVDDDVVWFDPSNKSKVTHSRKDISGNPIPDKHSDEDDQEILISGDSPAGNKDTVLVPEQSVEKSCIDEGSGPNHGRGPDEESTHDPSQRISDTLSRDNEERSERPAEVLSVEDILREENVSGVSSTSTITDVGSKLII